MHTAIKKILFGETSADLIKLTKEYKKLSEKSEKIYNELIENLTEEQIKQLDDIIDLESEMQAETQEEFYKEGLKLGLRLGFEAHEE